jgi:hypothetical protein
MDVHGLTEELADHAFHHVGEFRLVHEGGLDVELRELRLTIGAQVLVAETAGDLVIAIEPRHHQQLLEELWRLRQGEETAGMGAARDEVVPRAFRRGLGQYWSFCLDETARIQEVAQDPADPAAQAQIVLHRGTPQVHITIAQADVVVEVLLIEQEGRGLRGIQDDDLPSEDLHLA